jgi:hypothetical protein
MVRLMASMVHLRSLHPKAVRRIAADDAALEAAEKPNVGGCRTAPSLSAVGLAVPPTAVVSPKEESHRCQWGHGQAAVPEKLGSCWGEFFGESGPNRSSGHQLGYLSFAAVASDAHRRLLRDNCRRVEPMETCTYMHVLHTAHPPLHCSADMRPLSLKPTAVRFASGHMEPKSRWP